jgi:ADP-ribose pyrophosphatase
MTHDQTAATDPGDLPDLPHEEQTGSSRAFDGKMLRVRVDEVRLPSGRQSVREIVEHQGSVVIVPVTADDEVIMIRHYRHATGRTLLELPAGLIDPGEEILETARRELLEETGYAAGTLRHVTTVYVSPGYSEERTSIVLAEECVAVAHEPDPDEPIQILARPLASIPDLLIPGETVIENAQAMLGLLWLLRLRPTEPGCAYPPQRIVPLPMDHRRDGAP